MRPLADLRIVAVEQYGAGPFGSLHLADLGAEVIKVEDARVGGDVGRYVPPFADGEDSLFFQAFNRNKRSISLDLSLDAGREVLRDLVRHADAVYSNLRGDIPERLGITYSQLKDVNPRLVCCSLSGYGMTGPRRAEPAYDYILQGLAGWMALTGEPDGPPTKSGLSLVDYAGGLCAAFSLLAGVHAARRDGVGMDCDVSLFDVAISLLTYVAAWQLNRDYRVERTSHSAHPSLVPFQNFETADGWIVVGCAKEKFWHRLATVLGRGDLESDPRYANFDARRRNAATLLPELITAFRERPSAEWLERLVAAGVPCGPVNDVAEALREPQTSAREMVVELDHPSGPMRQVRTAVRVGDETPEIRAAPTRGQDRSTILEDLLGYDKRRIEELERTGAFGGATPSHEVIEAT